MRVLLVTDWPFEGGGVETYLMQVARGLRAAGDEVRLLTSSVGGGAAVADYVALGARSPVVQSVAQIANPAAARTMRRAIAEFRPDAAYVCMFEMYLSPSVLGALRAVPTVLSIAYYKPVCPNGLKLRADDSICSVEQGIVCWRGGCFSLAHWLRDRPRYARIRHEVSRCSAVVTCSQWMQDELARSGVSADWSPWPIEAPSPGFRRTPSAQPLFAVVGRLAREKGIDTLLHAVAQARQEVPGVRLRVVGDGPLRTALGRLTRELGLADAVTYTGWLPVAQVEEQIADAWALVAPSRWAEPLGLTVLEALARGIPVIASATGAFGEAVEDGSTGLLFANGDAGALARCLVEVASGRLQAAVSPEQAERVRRKHDLKAHLDWLRALFARVAA